MLLRHDSAPHLEHFAFADRVVYSVAAYVLVGFVIASIGGLPGEQPSAAQAIDYREISALRRHLAGKARRSGMSEPGGTSGIYRGFTIFPQQWWATLLAVAFRHR